MKQGNKQLFSIFISGFEKKDVGNGGMDFKTKSQKRFSTMT